MELLIWWKWSIVLRCGKNCLFETQSLPTQTTYHILDVYFELVTIVVVFKLYVFWYIQDSGPLVKLKPSNKPKMKSLYSWMAHVVRESEALKTIILLNHYVQLPTSYYHQTSLWVRQERADKKRLVTLKNLRNEFERLLQRNCYITSTSWLLHDSRFSYILH